MAAVRRLTLALVVGLLVSTRLGAQNPVPPTGTITGRVLDAATQQPVPDVSVFVEGTRRGAVTAADGSFTIGGVPSGSQVVRARRIGFGAPVQTVVVPNGFAPLKDKPESPYRTASSISFVGGLYKEEVCLAVAQEFQRVTEFHKKRPPVG